MNYLLIDSPKLYQQSIPNCEDMMLTIGCQTFWVIYALTSGHSSPKWKTGKNCPPSPGQARPGWGFLLLLLLIKETATHCSTLAWKIPWTEEPGRLQSMGSQRVRHNWATSLLFSSWLSFHTCLSHPHVNSLWFSGSSECRGWPKSPTSTSSFPVAVRIYPKQGCRGCGFDPWSRT